VAHFPDYEVIGVPDPNQLQADSADKCRDTLNLPVRPLTKCLHEQQSKRKCKQTGLRRPQAEAVRKMPAAMQ